MRVIGRIALALAVAAPGTTAQDATERAAALDYFVYVTAESADEVYLVRFDGAKAEVVDVIDVGYQPTEIEGPRENLRRAGIAPSGWLPASSTSTSASPRFFQLPRSTSHASTSSS